MSSYEEFQGADLEDALRQAGARFRVDSAGLKFELLREERGFLGVGSRQVTVRVSAPRGQESRRRPAPPPRLPRPAPAHPAVPLEDDAEPREAVPTGPDPTVPQVAELVKELIEAMQLELDSTPSEDDEHIVINLAGADRERLLDRRAELLNALQYLINRMARKRFGTVKRVQLESEGFRSERDEEIRAMAQAAADRALQSGESVRLPPLNPYERRIVHVAIASQAGLSSESEGDGFIKRITIRPEGAPRRRPEGRGESRGRGRGRSR